MLLGISFLVYAGALRNGFVADDDLQILRNKFVTDYHYAPVFFTTDVWGFLGGGYSNYYRPLQMAVFASEYLAFGNRPWAWHLVSLCVNSGAIAAAYFLLLELGGEDLALWGCLFFALHPMHVEAVVWVAALPDLICGLLLFLAMLAYHRARSRGGGRALWRYALAVLAFFAAALTKETALLFPVVLLSYEFFYRRSPLLRSWEALQRLLPYAAALALYLVMRVNALGALEPRPGSYIHLSAGQLAFAAPVLIARYLGKLLLPLHFNFFYFTPPITAFHAASGAAILLLALLVTAPFLLRKRAPLLAFGLAWFLLILLPALNINAIGENYFTERYLYIPSFGMAIFAATAWLWLLRKAGAGAGRWITWGGLAVALAFCVAQIERRIPVFHDDLSLYQTTVLASPNSARLQSGLALAYQEAGNHSQSIEHGLLAVKIDPAYEAAQFNLGNSLVESGRAAEGIEHLKAALALHPDYVPTLLSLARAYVQTREWSEAEQCYHRVQELDPGNAPRYQQFVENLAKAESAEKEIGPLREQADRNPRSVADRDILCRAYATLDEWDEAIACARQALKVDSGDAFALGELGVASQQKGDFAGAIAAYQQVLSLQPQNTFVRVSLGSALYSAGRIDESIAQFQQALRGDPAWPQADDVHVYLGMDYEQESDWADAAAEYEQALRLNPQQPAAQERLKAIQSRIPTH